MPETLTEELSKLRVGLNGGELQLPKQKSKAIALIQKTQQAISNYAALMEKSKKERKNLMSELRSTKVGQKLTQLENTEKEAKKYFKIFTDRYSGMLEAYAEIGISIEPKQIKPVSS